MIGLRWMRKVEVVVEEVVVVVEEEEEVEVLVVQTYGKDTVTREGLTWSIGDCKHGGGCDLHPPLRME